MQVSLQYTEFAREMFPQTIQEGPSVDFRFADSGGNFAGWVGVLGWGDALAIGICAFYILKHSLLYY